MARDEGDKSGKRRWGRGSGRAEEGPSEEDLGWLADLRGSGSRDERGPVTGDEPSSGFSRGRRGAMPADPRPASPAGGRGPAGPGVPGSTGGNQTGAPPTGAFPGGSPPAGPPRRRGRDLPDENTGDVRNTGDIREPRGRRGREGSVAGPLLPPAAPPPAVPTLGAGAPPTAPSRRPPPPPPPAGPPEPGRGRGRNVGSGESPSGAIPTGSLPAPAPPGRLGRPEGPTGGIPTGGINTGGLSSGGPNTGAMPGRTGPGGLPGGPGGPGRPLAGPGGPGPGGPGPGGPGGKPLDPLVTTGMIRRAEMRRQLKVAQQLKVATLVVVALLLLAAYPVFVFTRSLTEDPIFGELDGLNLPSWAVVQHDDSFSGSRWCIDQCRYRERTWVSEHKPDETNTVYVNALNSAGWRVRTSGVCPTVSEGIATCWQRDAYVLDMWVRAPICDIPPTRPATGGGATSAPTPTETCAGAFVTVKVFNAIDYHPVD